jgi:uncharacterized protein YqgC (DUF456 family)
MERQSMLESLSEHFALFYYLLQCFGSFIGLVLITIGIPGQFLPGIVALIVWSLGLDADDAAIRYRGFEALILLGLAVAAEIVEFLSGLVGGKSAGSSRRGAIGAILGGFCGGICGNIVFPLIGGIFGILVGTGVGAYMGEKSALAKANEGALAAEDPDGKALKVGIASLIGRALGLVVKLSIAMACLLYSFFKLLDELW